MNTNCVRPPFLVKPFLVVPLDIICNLQNVQQTTNDDFSHDLSDGLVKFYYISLRAIEDLLGVLLYFTYYIARVNTVVFPIL